MDLLPAYRPTVPEVLKDLAGRFADRLQILDETSALTFREVEAQSAILARGLVARGVGKGGRVGLLLPNGPAWVVAWFAITRIGAVAVQLSTFGKAREIAHVLRHADVQLMITADRYLQHDYLQRMEAAAPGLADSAGDRPLRLVAAPYLREAWVFGDAPAWARGNRADLERQSQGVSPDLLAAIEAQVHPADPAIMIYTSGSTAEPKAVVHAHGAMVRHAHVMAHYTTYKPGDRLLSVAPLFWVGGICTSLFTSSMNGATLVTPSTQSPSDIIRMIREKAVTHTSLAPGKARSLFGVDGYDEAEFLRLKPISAQQLFMFHLESRELTPDSLGMSETFGPHSMEFAHAHLPPDRPGSFGRAVLDIERKIIDPATGVELPNGEIGELCVRGYSLMEGYHKRERPESFDRDGWFHTGDLCALSDDGYLFFHGRRTEMLKTSGANVAPREVELVLIEHPDILEAAVLGLADSRLGQKVVAVVLPRQGAVLDESALSAWLQGELASYKVPKRILFLDPADAPRTDTGKIRKAELLAIVEQKLAEPQSN